MGKRFWRTVCALLVLGTACLTVSCKSEKDAGNEALRIGDYDRAIQRFSAALDESPADRDARYGMALACFGKAESEEKVGQHSVELWTKTQAEFRILNRIDSIAANEMYSSALFYLARAKVIGNSKANVLGILNESLRLDSANYFSMNLKALVLQGQGETDAAQQIFTEILTKNSDFAPAYSNLGNLYWEMGKIDEAWDVWSLGAIQFPENTHLKHWTKVAEDSLKALVLSRDAKQ